MPSRRRTGGGGGGAGGIAATVVVILMAAAVVVGWWNVNGFQSVGDAIQWFRDKSAEIDECVDSNVPDGEAANNVGNLIGAYDCGTPGPGLGELINNVNENSSKEELLALVAALPTAGERNVEYSRSEWRHWSDLDGNGCDTREDVLIASGSNVKTDPKTCKVLSGTWNEPYEPSTTTDSSSLDIDHVVSLGWAARNGGQDWPSDKKQQFANDPNNLFIASASENRSKSDKGPSGYLPPNEDFLCEFATRYATVVAAYSLTIPQPDKAALSSTIENYC